MSDRMPPAKALVLLLRPPPKLLRIMALPPPLLLPLMADEDENEDEEGEPDEATCGLRRLRITSLSHWSSAW